MLGRVFANLSLSLSMIVGLLFITSHAHALEKRTLCVFDIVGASGDTFNIMKDYKTAALDWGVDLELKPYTDEKITAEDLKGNQCDGAVLTGIRARQFNAFTGSIDSVGSIPSYAHMKTLVQLLAHPSLASNMESGPYEIAGIMPMGAAYLFVKDRTIDTVEELAGKTISVMEYDKAQAAMASRVGMSPVLSDISNFAGRFNNGSVDICFAPIVAYSALELYKGLEPDGGIVDYVLGQLTGQIVLRKDRFPEGFGAQSRTFVISLFDRAMRIIENADSAVDASWWVKIPEADRNGYDQMMRESRIALRDKGVYDAEMMALLRKIRCKLDPARSECTNPSE